ncbi:hypothetical protein PR048_013992 [Dryococelus australis]|uniref:Uncharacterized protein n=1 Tax=Dryococelus australis TaxID=614101 RepID=A0ABQ9HTR4_9NEOP|nr:hypothetical protein PR048_013992 [Dryococelus australis]
MLTLLMFSKEKTKTFHLLSTLLTSFQRFLLKKKLNCCKHIDCFSFSNSDRADEIWFEMSKMTD